MAENEKLLVTTALVESWGSNEEIVFLGEWCKPYDVGFFLEGRLHSTVPFHWSDNEKLRSDHDYLLGLFERVLHGLVSRLNDYHQVNRSSRYWRIILGPWLLHYLAVAWDRWEDLREACKGGRRYTSIALDLSELSLIPRDFTEFNLSIHHDLWNHELIKKIIIWEYGEQVRLCSKPFTGVYPSEEYASRLISMKDSLRDRVVLALDSILNRIQKKYSVVFVAGSFGTFSLLRLAANLRQLPRKHCEFFKKINVPQPSSIRGLIGVDIGAGNSFESFIENHIIEQIPITYLEGYNNVLNQAHKIRSDPQIIFTTNEHLHNDLFNIWSANQIDQGKKLIVSQHGGAIRSEMSLLLHQEKISDKMTVWHQPREENHVQLSPTKLISSRVKRRAKKDLSLIAFETSLYPYRAQSGPKGPGIIEDYSQKLDFISKLSPEVETHLSIRARSNGMGWFMSRHRFEDDVGIHRSAPQSRTLREAFAHSRLIVCTYPQTTFSEAMHSGIPTIMLYSENLWQLDSFFAKLLSELKNNRVVFSDPEVAARHVNEIWQDPDGWWAQPGIVRVREMFFDMCGRVRPDWLSEWVQFLRNELPTNNDFGSKA